MFGRTGGSGFGGRRGADPEVLDLDLRAVVSVIARRALIPERRPGDRSKARCFAGFEDARKRLADRLVGGVQEERRAMSRALQVDDDPVERRAVAVVAPDLEHVAQVHGERAFHGLDQDHAIAALGLQAGDLALALIDEGECAGIGVVVNAEVSVRIVRRIGRGRVWTRRISIQAHEARVVAKVSEERAQDLVMGRNHRSRVWLHLALCLTAALPCAAASQVIERATAIVGATIIDGNGGPPIVDGTIVVLGNRISAVGPRRVN